MSTSTQVGAVSSQSNPATSTTDSWESRIQSAATFMGLSTEKVIEGLKQLGVEKEPSGLEMLSDESITPFGDIRAIFCDNALFGQIPLAKVRLAMKYLRGPKDSQKTDSIDPELIALKTKYGIRMKMEDVDPSELLEHYHPEQPNHPVTISLKKRYGDKAIIAFKPDSNTVDIEETANYMADIEQGYEEQETIEVNGTLVRLYPIGKAPDTMVEEDPLFPGHALRRGRSQVNRLNWSDIKQDIRVFCRIVVDMQTIDEKRIFEVRELMKMAQRGMDELKKCYPEAYLEYRELAQKNELPKLMLTMESANGKKQNPFSIGSNRKF